MWTYYSILQPYIPLLQYTPFHSLSSKCNYGTTITHNRLPSFFLSYKINDNHWIHLYSAYLTEKQGVTTWWQNIFGLHFLSKNKYSVRQKGLWYFLLPDDTKPMYFCVINCWYVIFLTTEWKLRGLTAANICPPGKFSPVFFYRTWNRALTLNLCHVTTWKLFTDLKENVGWRKYLIISQSSI